MRIAAKYLVFAGIASGCNLALQYGVFSMYGGMYALYFAMAAGTGAGLVIKFVLDKFFIFYDTSRKPSEVSFTFVLYSLTGIGTTVLFWCIEIGFDAAFRTPGAKYAGAAVGLSLGYWIKYHLDKRMVFTRNGGGNGAASATGDALRGL
ncbi:MAG: GtrA family protein [Ignavibacteriales bacterium]|nr:GtrA family protein [Ignavibacteriales bacterium]